MALTLTVLGCCGSYPGPGQAASGYLVHGGGANVWVDAGSGTLSRLQQHLDLRDVDAVVLTHQHPDHWSDINSFHVAAKWFLDIDSVPVYAPRGVREAAYHRDLPLDWQEVADGDRVQVGGLTLGFSRTDHSVETLAVRADGDGRSLGYSSDTGPGWSLEALGPGLHLALCEATWSTDQEGKPHHMSARQAATTARAAGVERLLLTHLPPGADAAARRAEAAAVFGPEVDIAREHGVYEA